MCLRPNHGGAGLKCLREGVSGLWRDGSAFDTPPFAPAQRARKARAARRTMSRVPKLLIFDLDACLWSPEMFELRAAPTTYDAAAGGVRAGSEVVRLFPGALAVLRRLITDPALNSIKVAVASSTTEPAWANRCLDVLMVNAAENSTVGALVDFRQICALPGT